MVDKEFDEQTIKDLLEDAWDSANPGMGQKVKAYLSIQMYFHVLSTFRNLYQLWSHLGIQKGIESVVHAAVDNIHDTFYVREFDQK